MNRGHNWDDLVGRIYGAALDPGLWPGVLEAATEFVEARQGKLALLNLPVGEAVNFYLHRIDPAYQELWDERFVDRDPWVRAMYVLPSALETTGSALVPLDELRRSESYHECLHPDGAEDILLASLGDGANGRSFVAFFHRTPFDRRNLELLRRLAPHLRRATQVQERLMEVHGRAQAAERSLDRLRAGLIILASDGRVVFCNRRAEAILREADGVSLYKERLRCARAEEARQFEGAVAEVAATSNGHTGIRGRSLAISRPSLRRPFGVVVVPMRSRHQIRPLVSLDRPRGAAVLVLITDPEDTARPAAERLAVLFGLTPAEARLAAALAALQSVEDYAEQAGVTSGTVRWTLKRVLEKTGCRRQSELVHLIATSAAGMVWE